MDIVAGEAGHPRFTVTAALLQRLHLVAMHIERSTGIVGREVNVVVERVTGAVGERGLQRLPVAGVAPGAEVHLAIAGEVRRVEDLGFGSCDVCG